MSGTQIPVTAVTVPHPLAFPAAARLLARVPGLALYNCDILTTRLFFYETGLFPLARCAIDYSDGVAREIALLSRPEDLEYSVPSLVVLRLRFESSAMRTGDSEDAPARNPSHGRPGQLEASVDGETVILDGDDPAETIRSLNRLLQRYDPDVLLTEWGDSVLLPHLQALAARTGIPLQLNRDPEHQVRTRRSRSYMTYGQVVYQAGARMLHGRWHIDLRNSFIYAESELAGLLEVARLAHIPVQELARTSTGTAISSMQLLRAVRDGILIPWQKSEPEVFKTASQLIVTDKGGLTYQPLVGLYEQIGELDFSSMYPTIMAKFNVSPETIGCACCPDSRVPEINYTVCRRRRGLVPQALDHLLERRIYYKQRKQTTTGSSRALYDQRQTALKWCLVTCLDGETLVPFKKDGRIQVAPIREVIDPVLPDGPSVLPVQGLHVFGYDENLRPIENSVRNVIKVPAPSKFLCVRMQSGRELTMIPNHRCFVVEGSHLLTKRASELRVGDLIPVAPSSTLSRKPVRRINDTQSHGPFRCVQIRSIEEVPSTSPYTYCFEVERGLHGFTLANGIFTANSFGYLGYRNARFGRIEAHEAVTAFAREMLLRAKEVAESRGFRMLHALVDSMWLQRPGASRADYEVLAQAVTGATGLPIFVEGIYRWIGFLPSKTHRGVGVPNRYMGVFDNDTTKVRGIEVRRSDMPALVVQMQEHMLRRMFHCSTLADVRTALPEILGILENALVRLRAGDVEAAELVITNTLSQEVSEYRHNTVQAITARTLDRHGAHLHPGEAVQFILTDADAKVPEDRVRPYTLLGSDWHYDAQAYAALLLRAAASILELFGYPEERLRREVWEPVASRAGRPSVAEA
jgi:DNA polymerase elongation subunit (family B)